MPSIFDKWFKRQSSAPGAQATVAPSFETVYSLANGATAGHDFAWAIQLYDQAIALDPSHAEAHYKRANALKNIGDLSAALSGYDQAIAHRPDYAYAYCNRGVVQQSLGLTAAALSSYDQAIACDYGDAVAHYNRALLLQTCGRWAEALQSYDRAVSVDPNFIDAQYNRSLTQLLLGDFENGWRGFELRWKNALRLRIGESRTYTQPLWLGDEPIEGRTLLLYFEGGLGDTLQFCRYCAMASARGATVILEAQPALVGLLANLDGVSRLIEAGTAPPPFDYHCPLMSLPLAFGTTLNTIPVSLGYLRADLGKVSRWRKNLGERIRPRIGLVWSGNPNNSIDQRRSIRLADWAPRLPRGFQYFSLQKGVREADKAALDLIPFIVPFDDSSMDFPNTAALCACMDLVISVDTSVAHLCAAMGKTTWILLPSDPDWRWLVGRDDCPWYPTAKLYRQSTAGDWTGVFARIENDLKLRFGGQSTMD